MYLHRRYDFPFENLNVSKKVNDLLRKYDLFIQEYAKATALWDELTLLNAFGGSNLQKYFPQSDALTVRFWGGGARGRGDFFNRFQTLLNQDKEMIKTSSKHHPNIIKTLLTHYQNHTETCTGVMAWWVAGRCGGLSAYACV